MLTLFSGGSTRKGIAVCQYSKSGRFKHPVERGTDPTRGGNSKAEVAEEGTKNRELYMK